MEKQGIAAELENYRTLHWWRNGKEQVHFLQLHSMMLQHVSVVKSLCTKYYGQVVLSWILHVWDRPGFKFQYGAWLSWLIFLMVFLFPSRQTAEYEFKFCRHFAVWGIESTIKWTKNI
jgi:hypothetical protein